MVQFINQNYILMRRKSILNDTKRFKGIKQSLLIFLFSMGFFGTWSQVPILAPGDAVEGGAIEAGTIFTYGTANADVTPGFNRWPAGEAPSFAMDGVSQKYLNNWGPNSGLAVTPAFGSSIVCGMRIWTSNDVESRDPASYSLYGKTTAVADGQSTASYTLISSGALALPAGRNGTGAAALNNANSQLISFSNTGAYTSYLIIFPTLKNAGADGRMQIAEIQLYGIAPADLAVCYQGAISNPTAVAVGNTVAWTTSNGTITDGTANDNMASLALPPNTGGATIDYALTDAAGGICIDQIVAPPCNNMGTTFTVTGGEDTAASSGTFSTDDPCPGSMCDWTIDLATDLALGNIARNRATVNGNEIELLYDVTSSNAANTYTSTIDFAIDNCPDGLEPVITISGYVSSGGLSMNGDYTFTWTGGEAGATAEVIDPDGQVGGSTTIASGSSITQAASMALNTSTWIVILPQGATDVTVVKDGGNRFEGLAFSATLATLCPVIGALTCDPEKPIVHTPFDVNVTGLENMGTTFGLDIVMYPGSTTPADPYDLAGNGGVVIATVANGDLINGGTEALVEGLVGDMAGDFVVCAILNPAHCDTTCTPSACGEKTIDVPTMGEWGLIILCLSLVTLGVVAIKQKTLALQRA